MISQTVLSNVDEPIIAIKWYISLPKPSDTSPCIQTATKNVFGRYLNGVDTKA